MWAYGKRAVRSRCRQVLVALACACAGICATSAAAPLTLRFEHLGVEQGMPQESISCILQDSHGYMWFGTQAGLGRYDGYRISSFKNDPAHPGSILDNYILVLHEDGQGRLWVGSKGGLDRYDPVAQAFVHFPVPGGSHAVTAIAGDGKQGLWLATADGLRHFDPATGQFSTQHHDAGDAGSLRDEHVSALLLDARGNLWVGTQSGIELRAAGSTGFRHFTLDEVADGRDVDVLSLSMAPDGTLWVGTTAGLRLLRADPAPGRTGGANALGATALQLPPGEALLDRRITALFHDSEGVLWAGTFTDGLRRRDALTGRFHAYRRDALDRHSVGDNQVSALYQDRSGTLWVGTWYTGADRVDLASGGFERYTESTGVLPGIGSNKVRSIAGDGEGRLWLAAGDGLTLLDPAKGTVQLLRNDLLVRGGVPGNQMALATDRRNRLWMGSPTGLAWRDPDGGAVTMVSLGADPLSNSVQRVRLDRNGVIWVASRDGLHSVVPDTGAQQDFLPAAADSGSRGDGRVYAFIEDSHGTFWMGTTYGLDRFDRASGTFRHYRHDPRQAGSLGHNRVHALLEDSKGRLWVGTSGGLYQALPGAAGALRFRYFPPGDGAVPDPVGAILEDGDGRLWISTTAGILRFDPGSGAFKSYTSRDGLIDGSYFISSGYKSADGTMYFGGLNGLTAFQPERIHDNPTPPQVALTDFSIFNQSVQSGERRADVLAGGPLYAAKALTLSYLDSVFSFEFAALHHADPQRNRYAYQLEGFDSHWVMADAGKRFATYTNLDPGHYVFRVRASNKDGVWNAAATEVTLTITPPFWKTWWFRLLAVAAVLGAVYGLFRIRIRLLLRQKHDLEQEVGNRTRELLLQKESVEGQKREVEHQKESVELAHRNISRLSDIGRQITANLDSEAIMAMLYRQVEQLMDASVFGIGIYRSHAELIEYPFAMERGKRYAPYTRSMREPNQLAVWCVQHAREVFINDLHLEYARYVDRLDLITGIDDMGTLEDGSLPTEPRSLIYVPISVGGQVRGVITVHSYREHAYQRIDLDMLNTLASYVAVAFDNADAYRQLQDTQQQLVAREKLAALGSLVAGVAHELNTPIGNSLVIASTLEDKTAEIAVKSAGQTMRRSDLADFIEASKEASGLLMRSLRNAAELVNSFKQVAVDQASAKRRFFNLLQCSQEITATIMNRVRKSGHRLELDMPDDIVMDSFPGPYGQVIINLINNALLHAFEGRDGGLMRMTAARMGTERVRLVFEDDGVGIAIDHLARIFDPFFTTKLGQGGNGLGLSITYNIVTSLLDGEIRVDSVLAQGTSFTIDLPLKASLSGDTF